MGQVPVQDGSTWIPCDGGFLQWSSERIHPSLQMSLGLTISRQLFNLYLKNGSVSSIFKLLYKINKIFFKLFILNETKQFSS